MPPLTAPPTVVVFSSNSKISNAKIRKYTTASEKGLSVYDHISSAPVPFIPPGVAAPLNGTEHLPGQPSSKRQRLSLVTANGGSPALPGQPGPSTHAGSRPKRRRPRPVINLDTDIYFEDGITPAPEPEMFLSSDEDSDSDLTPPPPNLKAPTPVPDPPTPEDLEYGAGFTSYYVIDDDAEDGKEAPKAPAVRPPSVKKPESSWQQPKPMRAPQDLLTQPRPTHTQAPRQRQSSSRSAPHTVPQQAFPPPMPQPTVTIINNIKSTIDPNKPPTLAEMIKKLDLLSAALVKFGGHPPNTAPQQPQGDTQIGPGNLLPDNANGALSKAAPNKQGDESVDNFLGMFDEGDESDEIDAGSPATGDEASGAAESDSKDASSGVKTLDVVPSTTGIPDEDLNYGIEFIMNALSTWAKQRIHSLYTQQWHQYNEMIRQQQQNPLVKKGRGRPKKDEQDQRPQIMHPPPPPSVINAELTNTPEGEAVQAFRDVLDCGVLRANGLLPVELTRALGTLYVQIDHLINNSKRQEPQWECMSYHAQIMTQRIKVDRWKEQLARMQAELERQQELSHQQMMSQMNVPPHLQHRGVMTHEQALKHRDMSLELKRGTQQAAHTPYLTQNLTTPMDMNKPKPSPVTVPSSASPPATAGASNAPNAQHRPSPSRPPSSVVNAPANSRVHDAMSRVTMYHDGRPTGMAPEHAKALSMRSGQGMKFSFDHGEAARKLFGDQAFPAAGYGSSIPRRGPMGKPFEQTTPVVAQAQTPVLSSNAPPLNGSTKEVVKEKAVTNGTGAESPSETIEVKTNGVRRPSTSKSDANNDNININTRPASKQSDNAAQSVSPNDKTNGNTKELNAARPGSKHSDKAIRSASPVEKTHKRKRSDSISVNSPAVETPSASASPAPARQTRIRLRNSHGGPSGGSRRSAYTAAAAATR